MAKTKGKRKKKGDPNLYGIIEKGSNGTEVRIYKNEFKGKDFLHIREFFEDDDGDKMPTKKGVTLREKSQIVEVMAALDKARKDF